ncbi:hypothetical protein NE237_029876 [Protea cynaroides]|uniref:Uncharacterized protein n=1 Tax=Protea cynaroides TaxID=273540 RepID=A0A9Q0JUB4_9MAGN|nr:hypothetical protein NE237_029876 [Protea cynaroides]
MAKVRWQDTKFPPPLPLLDAQKIPDGVCGFRESGDMATSSATSASEEDCEALLLSITNDAIHGVVDYEGGSVSRSHSGGWRSNIISDLLYQRSSWTDPFSCQRIRVIPSFLQQAQQWGNHRLPIIITMNNMPNFTKKKRKKE